MYILVKKNQTNYKKLRKKKKRKEILHTLTH